MVCDKGFSVWKPVGREKVRSNVYATTLERTFYLS